MHPGVPVWHEEDKPADYSYAGVLVRAARGELLRHLADAGFSGWVGPQEDDWVVLVPARPRGAVTATGLDLETLGVEVARRFDALTLATAVERDRLLRLAMWDGSRELGRYVSNPAYGVPDDDEVWPEPEGAEHAHAYATACGHADRAEELTELLGEMLDEESQIESERLSTALRLLGLPRWLVAANSLPKDVPSGPPAREFVRLFRGGTGVPARMRAWLIGLVRWHRTS
jgi:hypothetical protein